MGVGAATLIVPEALAAACRGIPERTAWLEGLPRVVREMQDRWSLSLGAPYAGETSCAWVAPAVRCDGTRAVLKVGMPHMEGAHEAEALSLCDGEPTVRLLEAESDSGAMLLEICEPGTALRDLPETEQDVVIAGLLRRFWRRPPSGHAFRPLSAMTAHWAQETLAAAPPRWVDAGLVRAGLQLFEDLSRPSGAEVLLATDLHAGNVLRAQREPWLVIDPKPFVGDPAYDATQHLLNCEVRMRAEPRATIRRFADLLGVDADRVRLWMFARRAAEPRDTWDAGSISLARALG